MKFIFDKSDMLNKLLFAKEVISSKNAMSIMSNVLFTLAGNTLEIRGVDTKFCIKATMNVDCIEEGSGLVYLDKFLSILTNLPNGEVDFITANDKTEIIPRSSKKVKFKLKTLSDSQYPSTYALDANVQYTSVSAATLQNMLSFTVGSTSSDETRYFLCGVYFENDNGVFNMVATNGNLLSQYRSDLPFVGEFANIIVPTKILNVVANKFSSEGYIDIGFNNNNVYFRQGDVTLSSVILDGKFPDYRKVIPQNQPCRLEVSYEDFSEAIKRVGQLVDANSKQFIMDINKGKVTISSNSSSLGEAEEEIEAIVDGDAVKMAFDIDKIKLTLRSLKDEKLIIEYSESARPITISNGDVNQFHVVMPMRIA